MNMSHDIAGRTSWLPLLLISVGLAYFSLQTVAQSADPDAADETEATLLTELKALDQKLTKIEDLKASITQRKHVALLKKPLTSQGSMRVKGDQMRWDMVKPAASTTITSATEIRIHYPDQKIVEVYRVDQRMASVIASPLPRLAMLLKHFRLARLPSTDETKEKDQLAIRLVPKAEALKKHLARVDVIIDRQSAVASRMEIVDVDGDRTIIEFDSIELNTGIKSKDLELTLPAGTRIVHPLEDGDKSSP